MLRKAIVLDLNELSDNQIEKEYQSRFWVAPGIKISSPDQAARHFTAMLSKYKNREVFSVMFLDAQNKHLTTENLFLGTLTESMVYPREIIRKALRYGAAAIILAHNHPSGDVKPSQADIELTKIVAQICKIVEIKVLDHVIIAQRRWSSFCDRDLL
jgi:DNA repair protein RadC